MFHTSKARALFVVYLCIMLFRVLHDANAIDLIQKLSQSFTGGQMQHLAENQSTNSHTHTRIKYYCPDAKFNFES